MFEKCEERKYNEKNCTLKGGVCMDLHEQKNLFEQLVTSKIVQTEFGLIELPVYGLQEFHDRVGLGSNELCFFALRLPEYQEGFYNYYVGEFPKEDVQFEVVEAFYYDPKADESEDISFGDALVGSFRRSLQSTEAMLCGDIMIDNYGRAWMAFMISEDIGVRTVATFKPKTLGIPIFLEGTPKSGRLWFNGESFCYSPMTFVMDGDTFWPL